MKKNNEQNNSNLLDNALSNSLGMPVVHSEDNNTTKSNTDFAHPNIKND